ncbi:MAG: hypothetical protein IGS39_24380 [Calothrix sp. C42_A2020_038]|nr:hypothetical protein [Calothrix sp. C42_A2020_038]
MKQASPPVQCSRLAMPDPQDIFVQTIKTYDTNHKFSKQLCYGVHGAANNF